MRASYEHTIQRKNPHFSRVKTHVSCYSITHVRDTYHNVYPIGSEIELNTRVRELHEQFLSSGYTPVRTSWGFYYHHENGSIGYIIVYSTVNQQ